MRMIWKLVIFALMVSLFIANIPQKVDASVSVSAHSAVLNGAEIRASPI